ncbi:MAG: aspartyl-tRNA synthetase [Actinomycetota bacterium]|nr:aspartyl-tRNA synthetase [Actinomycetota bacterium]
MMRTDRAGDLRGDDKGREVTLCGWVAHRRDHGGVVFLDLRDVGGIVQVVVDPTSPGCEAAHRVRAEWVLQIRGSVRTRPDGTVNADMATGEIEVAAESVDVLSESEAIPFPLDDHTDVDEILRLRYRYLDLRRAPMQRNLRIRAAVNRGLRSSMEAEGFVEVETPMLIASTPEGARDFVVPSRLRPGSFYALPQSPQLFKQLLMVGGFDRYYQLARCLRDEDLRADRQFEFIQLDAEMTFAGQDDVIDVISKAVVTAAEAVRGEPVPPVVRMTWLEAMERYGSDKPDLRFAMELVELSEVFAATEFRAFAGAETVKGIRVEGQGTIGRSRVDALVDRAKELGAAGLVWMRVTEGSVLESPVVKFLSEAEQLGVVDALGARPGDLVLIAAGDRATTRSVLGQIRLDLGRPPVGEGPLRFLWLVDFPLFEGLDTEGRPIPAHHAFTMPHPDDLERLESDPLSVRSQSYDLVINGWELGSGSVRIHRPEIQRRVFALLGIEEQQAQERFGFLLDAFRFGAPPHAGFAFGVDRLVAVLAGEENIREVIAFPKTQSGSDPLTDAPSPIDPNQLRELGLQLRAAPRAL